MKRISLSLILVSSALICVLTLSCGERDSSLNLIIIGVDTLRPDHLGCYGYERETSPNIDRFADDGVLFENVISAAPWTLPSFGTVFTSLYPSQHGANSLETSLRTSFPTLATILQDRGYATGALINASVLKQEFGIDRGFAHYDLVSLDRRLADATTDDALEWIDMNVDSPFFLFIHYFDVHDPYAPPAPYDTVFDPGYKGLIGNAFKRKRIATFRSDNFSRMRYLLPADWRHIRALYDGEIAFTDKAIGTLLDGLARRGLRKNTLVVFLSDHGEEFYEHEGFGHGHTLYGEILRVPLVFSLPGTLPKGRRHTCQVRLVDVAPTILDILGFEQQPHFEGVSLKPLILRKGDPPEPGGKLFPKSIAYSEAVWYGTEKKAIVAPPWKLIYDTQTRARMLLNVAEDPGEQQDFSDSEPELLQTLSARLLDSMLSISNAWYVRISGDGDVHDFDIRLVAGSDTVQGRVSLYQLRDDEGRPVNTPSQADSEAPPSAITLHDLKIGQPLTLALIVEPEGIPLTLDLWVDGAPAVGKTFVGHDLSQPSGMPFVASPEAADRRQMREVSKTLDGPHLLVWHGERRYSGRERVRLDEQTGKELRALGYIQ